MLLRLPCITCALSCFDRSCSASGLCSSDARRHMLLNFHMHARRHLHPDCPCSSCRAQKCGLHRQQRPHNTDVVLITSAEFVGPSLLAGPPPGFDHHLPVIIDIPQQYLKRTVTSTQFDSRNGVAPRAAPSLLRKAMRSSITHDGSPLFDCITHQSSSGCCLRECCTTGSKGHTPMPHGLACSTRCCQRPRSAHPADHQLFWGQAL